MKPLKTILLSVFMVATGQILLKLGLNGLGKLVFELNTFIPTFIKVFSTPLVLIGLLLFVTSSVLWLVALSKSELSFTYPMLSVSYALVAALSFVLLKEPFSVWRGLGIVIIVMGVFLMSKS